MYVHIPVSTSASFQFGGGGGGSFLSNATEGERTKYRNEWRETKGAYTGHDGDEELRAIGVGPGVGHGQGVGAVVAKVLVKLVLKFSPPYGLSSSPVTCSEK